MNGTIDPSLFALFADVASAGGVRIASQNSGLPRSTISRQLAALEAKLGVRLFQRSTRALTVTAEGRVLLERIREPLRALSDAESAVRAMRERPAGTLKIAAPLLFAETFLGPVFETYARRYPEVRLQLVFEDRMVSIVDEGFDCVLRVGTLADSSLIAKVLGRGTSSIFASPDYLKTRGEPRRPKDLLAHDTLAFTGRKQPNKWVFTTATGRVSVTVTPRVGLNSFLLLRDLCCAGFGIAQLPSVLGRQAVQHGALVEVLTSYPSPSTPMSVIYPSERHLAARTRAFIDLLVEYCAKNPLDRWPMSARSL